MLVGLGAGAGVGSAAGARRAATAFPRLVDDLRPSDVVLTPSSEDPVLAAVHRSVAQFLGVPAGVVLGRQAWNALALRLAVPVAPSSSLLALGAAIGATRALANAAAAIAGIRARRLPPTLLLRAE